MKKTILTLIFGMVTFCSNGQSFLSNYPKLTRKNLNEFFTDWKTYSDSIALKATTNDSLMNRIQRIESLPVLTAGQPDVTKASPRYFVLPQYIKIERYDIDVDTITAKLDLGFPSFIPDMKDSQYTVDSIMPVLPREGLYLTPDINRILSTFAGGLKENDKTVKIKKGNVRRLKKYIAVDYGHWGGYWWFTSFPLITGICHANNLIAVMRRTSWCTGDVVWYIKENDAFVRQPKSVVSWIE